VAEARNRFANLTGYDDLPAEAVYPMEDHLDHRHLIAAINGLFARKDFSDFVGAGWIENALVRQLAQSTLFASYKKLEEPLAAARVSIGTQNEREYLLRSLEALPGQFKQEVEIQLPCEINEVWNDVKLYAYLDFGLYLLRSQRFYLAIRCGPIGQNGNGGHAHNDQLSIELNVDGVDWITDPGTYLYTPLPARRNEYRSVKAHFAPQGDGEPGSFKKQLFNLGDEAKGTCLYFGENEFIGKHRGYGYDVYRSIRLTPHRLNIVDYADEDHIHQITAPMKRLYGATMCSLALSLGYGIRYA
jgi:hypothetical protein